MDMTLEERIAQSNTGKGRGGRGRRAGSSGVNKNRAFRGERAGGEQRTGRSNKGSGRIGADPGFDNGNAWKHDKWEDEDDAMIEEDHNHTDGDNDRRGKDTRHNRGPRLGGRDRGFKVWVSNLHPEVGEDELRRVFSGPGGLINAKIIWERDRSSGRAFALYETYEQAHAAVRDFDGQLSKGQEITVKHDTAPRDPPPRSLEERITKPRARSASPARRRELASRPVPAGIDRYVPGDRNGRSGGRTGGRRRGDRRGGGGGRAPRSAKTKEELDAEMDDYFGKEDQSSAPANVESGANDANNAAILDDDVDML